MSLTPAIDTIEIPHSAGHCPVILGRDLLTQPQHWAHTLTGAVLVVTEQTVAEHHLKPLMDALGNRANTDVLVLPPGESTKNIAAWSSVLDRLVSMGAMRDATVIALGGGVIGDLAGFAAASYMRGIAVIQMPTTLLAQVDAAIGGKTAINHPQGKNLIGAFQAPRAVVSDLATLDTLSDRHYRAGLAEVIKYGAIGDIAFFEWLESRTQPLSQRDPETLQTAIRQSVINKKTVVVEDERETGRRAHLNFGHTFGHALEALTEYGSLEHGEAVAIGMVLAARLSSELGLLHQDQAQRLSTLIEALGLPTEAPAGYGAQKIIERMRLDKKNKDNTIHLVLLDDLGHAVIRPTSEAEITQAF